MCRIRTRATIDAAAGREHISRDSQPFTDVRQGQGTVIIAAVRELHIEITSRVTHQACHPDNSIAAPQQRQDLVGEVNIHFLACEFGMTAKWAYRVVAKPLRV